MNQSSKQIARLHILALHDSFLNNLGVDFLTVIYDSIIKDLENTVVIFREKNKLVGFAVATRNPKNFIKRVVTNCLIDHPILTLSIIISKPLVMAKAIYWQFFDKKPNPQTELQFIAVDKKFRNRGLGKKLIDELGIKEFIVGTKSNNELSNNFYRKLGFKYIGKFSAFGEPLNYYLARYLKKNDSLPPKN